MKIELKNIKINEANSDETQCFSATVYIDGKKAGTAHNDGRGGENYYSSYELGERLRAYAKTLPPFTYTYEGVKREIPQDADIVIGDIMREALYARDLKRHMSRKIVYRDNTGCLMETKPLDKARLAAALQLPNLVEKLNAEMVLNLMPFDQALPIYISHAGY